ncbi:pyridoxamine 5'-phosphate oxidase family protein [Paragemmobacter straminiformis]|uniref:Pyridoxamine 5'-phosphate oxidase family protein n=1 Tax=Paragemmobacter straminiformis TaxID=2045119 RepID=A0A842I619_9RHOB|nr:pyridoxamine 5'-phosphate oxidase family protein [Gemmobacter straminiformis]MBC2834398.1 pyridoxamine 5'-phosphate oxidase family protein [Gemmobacter straminiformis]
MTDDRELRAGFWRALHSDRTVMLGLEGGSAAPRPMTAITEGEHDHGPIWIFTGKDTELGAKVTATAPAFFTFAASDHALFATVHGLISPHSDPAVVERLWNPFIAAWYPQGRDDKNLLLLRFDPSRAEIWKNGSGLFAGLQMLLGRDPKPDVKGHVTKGPLH